MSSSKEGCWENITGWRKVAHTTMYDCTGGEWKKVECKRPWDGLEIIRWDGSQDALDLILERANGAEVSVDSESESLIIKRPQIDKLLIDSGLKPPHDVVKLGDFISSFEDSGLFSPWKAENVKDLRLV